MVLDDQSNPTIDVQLTAGLIAKHVNAIIQGGLAASCRATVPLVSANGPVMYCLSPSYTPQLAGYVFVSGTSTLDGMHALFNYFKWHNWKRFAVMSTTDASGQEGDVGDEQLLAMPAFHDVQITDYEHFAPADLSVQAQMIKIRESKPDVADCVGQRRTGANGTARDQRSRHHGADRGEPRRIKPTAR